MTIIKLYSSKGLAMPEKVLFLVAWGDRLRIQLNVNQESIEQSEGLDKQGVIDSDVFKKWSGKNTRGMQEAHGLFPLRIQYVGCTPKEVNDINGRIMNAVYSTAFLQTQ